MGEHADLTTHRIEGFARHGGGAIDVPLISEYGPVAEGRLWQGGCIDGLAMQGRFDFILSLYPWEHYSIDTRTSRLEVTMFDAMGEIDADLVFELAAHLWFWLERGAAVLVHCQAGLNRSSLVIASMLVRNAGLSPAEAIESIRATRSPLCLCNEDFEQFVRDIRPPLKVA